MFKVVCCRIVRCGKGLRREVMRGKWKVRIQSGYFAYSKFTLFTLFTSFTLFTLFTLFTSFTLFTLHYLFTLFTLFTLHNVHYLHYLPIPLSIPRSIKYRLQEKVDARHQCRRKKTALIYFLTHMYSWLSLV